MKVILILFIISLFNCVLGTGGVDFSFASPQAPAQASPQAPAAASPQTPQPDINLGNFPSINVQDWNRVLQNIHVLQNINEIIKKVLKKVEQLTEQIPYYDKISEFLDKVILKGVQIGSKCIYYILPCLNVLGNISSTIMSAIAKIFRSLAKIIPIISTPLLSLFSIVSEMFVHFSKSLNNFATQLKRILGYIPMPKITKLFKSLWNKLKITGKVLKKLLTKLKAVLKAALNNIKDILRYSITILGKIIKFGYKIIKAIAKILGYGLLKVNSSFLNSMGNLTNQLRKILQKIFQKVSTFLVTYFQQVLKVIISLFLIFIAYICLNYATNGAIIKYITNTLSTSKPIQKPLEYVSVRINSGIGYVRSGAGIGRVVLSNIPLVLGSVLGV